LGDPPQPYNPAEKQITARINTFRKIPP